MRAYVLRSLKQVERVVALLREEWRPQAAAGRALEVLVAENGGHPSARQYAQYWRYVLGPISEQVVLYGRRYRQATWHEQFKREFIGFEEDAEGQIVGLSTHLLSPAQFHDFMLKVQAHAAQEWGVVFEDEER